MSPAAITPNQFSTFGQLFSHLRRKTRLTQRELAIAVGYSDTQISRSEFSLASSWRRQLSLTLGETVTEQFF
jgi:hypothetical protein